MGDFHCPMGAAFYDDEGCIDCGLCSATTKEEMVEASKKIREYLRSHAEMKSVSKKIAVCGKGGTGKSTVVTLMANVLKEEGYTVLVIDTDESNPGLFRMFGFNKQPTPLMLLLDRFSLGETKPEAGWLGRDEILIQDIPSEYVLENGNLKFLMVGKIDDPFQGCACSMADVTRDFTGKLLIRDKEVVLIDMEAGIESFGRGVERSVDTVLVIVEPSFESLALAEKIGYMAEGIGVNRVRAILNKVPSEGIEEKIIEKLKEKSIKFVGTVYYDVRVSEAGFEGKVPGDSKAKEEMRKIARRLLDES
ncbi:P-loop NTPase [Chloroflexota bacterium]